MAKVIGYAGGSHPEEIERQRQELLGAYPDAEVLVDDAHRGLFHMMFSRHIDEGTVVACSILQAEETPEAAFYLLTYALRRRIGLRFLREPFFDTEILLGAKFYPYEERQDWYDEKTTYAAQGEDLLLQRLLREQIRTYYELGGLSMPARQPRKRGVRPGMRLVTRKQIAIKPFLLANSRAFGGSMTDRACIQALEAEDLHVSHNTLAKYKRELKKEIAREAPTGGADSAEL